jgi:protein disulfide-isomerase
MAGEAVNWSSDFDTAKAEAAQTGKLVLLHFYSNNCGPCRNLEQNVFSQPQVGEAISRNFVPVKINADQNRDMAMAFRVDRVPLDIVVSPQGDSLASLPCPQNPSEYLGQLSQLVNNYRLFLASQRGAPAEPAVQPAYAGLRFGQYANQQPAAPIAQSPAVPVVTAPTMTSNPYAGPPASSQTMMPANAMPNSYHSQPPVEQAVAAAAPAPAAPSAPTANPATIYNTQPAAGATAQALPSGCPPLAFDGYCSVSLKSAHKWVRGTAKFGAIHRGRTFLFAGEQQQQQFLADPDAYCPVFSGMDPVLLLEGNQVVEGSRRYGFEYRGAFYLFANQDSMNRFKADPDHYAAGVRQAMQRMDAGAGGTVLR